MDVTRIANVAARVWALVDKVSTLSIKVTRRAGSAERVSSSTVDGLSPGRGQDRTPLASWGPDLFCGEEGCMALFDVSLNIEVTTFEERDDLSAPEASVAEDEIKRFIRDALVREEWEVVGALRVTPS
jgi:hypothetical protein